MVNKNTAGRNMSQLAAISQLKNMFMESILVCTDTKKGFIKNISRICVILFHLWMRFVPGFHTCSHWNLHYQRYVPYHCNRRCRDNSDNYVVDVDDVVVDEALMAWWFWWTWWCWWCWWIWCTIDDVDDIDDVDELGDASMMLMKLIRNRMMAMKLRRQMLTLQIEMK